MTLQVGYRVASRENKLTKPELGHLKKHNAPALRNLREFKVREPHTFAGRGFRTSSQCLRTAATAWARWLVMRSCAIPTAAANTGVTGLMLVSVLHTSCP